MKQLKLAVLLSYLNIGITIVVGIMLTPYVIKMLGDEEYGLYSLIGAFVGYLSVLDLGLNNAIIRYAAFYRANKDKKGEENFLAISFIIYIVIGILIAILGGVLYWNVENLFGDTLTLIQLGKAKLMLLILILNIAFTLPGAAITGICTGYEAFIFPRVLSILKYMVRAVLVVVILYYGADALGIVILDTVMNFIFIAASLYYVLVKLKVSIKLHQFEWGFIKEIFGYSIWIFIFGLVYEFQWRTGQVILGANTTTVTVAVFAVGVMLGIYFTTFGNVINRLLLPKAVKNIEEKATPEMLSQQLIQVGRISLMVLLFILGGFILIGKEFILLWVGRTYNDAWLIALLIMVVYIMPISQGYAHAILEAKKLLRFKTLSFLISTIIGLILGGILSNQYGALGMIWGLFVPLFLLHWIVMNIFYKIKIGLNITLFFIQSAPLFVSFLISLTFCFLIFKLFESGWGNLLVKILIYSVVFIGIIWFVLNKKEKQFLYSKL